jgi:hypothetical protein
VNEDSVCFLTKLFTSGYGLIKGHTGQLNVQPLSTVTLDVVYFQFWRVSRHKNGAFDFKLLAAICDSLSMISRTACTDSPLSLLSRQSAKSIGSSSDLETAHRLKILSFEVYLCLVLCAEEVGLLQLCLRHNAPILPVSLIYFIRGHDVT